MTPQSHTLYSVCLFYALNALLLWTARRQRNAQRRTECVRALAELPAKIGAVQPVESAA